MANIAEINAEIKLNGMKDLMKELNTALKAVDSLTDGLTDMDKVLAGNTKAFKKTSKEVGGMDGEFSDLVKQVAKSADVFGDTTDATTDAAKAMGKTNDTLRKTITESKKVGTEIGKMGQEFKGATGDVGRTAGVMAKVDREFTQVKGSSETAGNSVRGAGDDFERMGNKAKNSGNDLKKVPRFFDGIKESAAGIKQVMKTVGDAIETAADKAMSVTKGVGAFGVGALASHANIDNSLTRMNASLGDTGKVAEQNKAYFKEVAKTGVASYEDISAAIVAVKRNMGTNDTTGNMAKQALAIADVFGEDVTDVTIAASQLMKNFGMDGNEAMGYILSGFQGNLNYANDFLDTVKEYSPHFKNASLTADDFFSLMKNGQIGGAFNTDYVADAVKEYNIKLSEMSDGTAEALGTLGFDAGGVLGALNAGGEDARRTIFDIANAIGNVADKATRQNLMTEIFGTKGEDITGDFVDMLKGMESGYQAAGSGMETFLNDSMSVGDKMRGMLNEIGIAIDDVLGDDLKGIIDSFSASLPGLIDALAPFLVEVGRLIQEYLPIFIVQVGEVTEWLGSLSGATIENAVGLVGMVAAAGPVLSVLSSLIKGVSSVVKLFGGEGIAGGLAKMVGGAGKAFGSLLGGIGSVFGALKTAIAGAVTAVAAFLGIPAWAVVAIAAAIAGVVALIWKYRDEIGAWLKGVGEWLVAAMSAAFESISGWLAKIWEMGAETRAKILAFLQGILQGAVDFFLKIGEMIGNYVQWSMDNLMTLIAFFGEKFTNMQEIATGIWETIKEVFRKGIESIKNLLNFEWKWPKIPLPHFRVEGELDLSLKDGDGLSMPKMAVDWYKTGGIFTGASVIGVGEAGDEAVVPLSDKSRMRPFAEAVAAMIPEQQLAVNTAGGSTQEIYNNEIHLHATVRNDEDIKRIAHELHKLEERKYRAKGRVRK